MSQSSSKDSRTTWTEEDRLAVLATYLEKHDKSLSDSHPDVVKLAERQGRSESSVVYKLQNFRFLDRRSEFEGKNGLSEFSKGDVSCWVAHADLPLSDRALDVLERKGWMDLAAPTDENVEEIVPSGITTALLAKPFLILTGPSGTGKTRGAVELAEAVCEEDCWALIAVGADWTDNRHVLGYLNPLQTADGKTNGTPIYETTLILGLILQANEAPEKPHVLILDEMNLSHVERYFADLLSAMEIDDKAGALKLHSADLAQTRAGIAVPSCVDFPSNLFVIGTVNIDETTYMFSPKVLDRANVIEIHAEATALEAFLRGSGGVGSGVVARDYGISFLEAAEKIRDESVDTHVPELPDAVRQAATGHLMALFNIMKRGRSEFGFRTGKEVMAYLRSAHFLAGPGGVERTAWAVVGDPNGAWTTALDKQILQKILPKLHGSRSRLAPLLGALTQYCATGDEASAMQHFPNEDGSAAQRSLKDACATPDSDPVFAKSYGKLKRMIEVLLEEQFVSFIC